jgi:hypothetical protein
VGDFICQGDDIMFEELDLDQRGRDQYVHGCEEALGVHARGESTHPKTLFSSIGYGEHEAVLSADVKGSSYDVQCVTSAGEYTRRFVPAESVDAFMRNQVAQASKTSHVRVTVFTHNRTVFGGVRSCAPQAAVGSHAYCARIQRWV